MGGRSVRDRKGRERLPRTFTPAYQYERWWMGGQGRGRTGWSWYVHGARLSWYVVCVCVCTGGMSEMSGNTMYLSSEENQEPFLHISALVPKVTLLEA
ncbi:hypothetical protein BDP55DRAFT_14493 [Colletotrichum godetiae]|uniref:Uncharacterized protein n=1 Tax=Colletotrichum godetiae TaxID=1209918 RepID=A0AAJ0F333_9PEZI|nr:uncharacterized protein BDP55DRAFT_14493 [Colletotrichum godetiae]KAK1701236.1 hypothetical protein BDP55DRAFT_14493 [Colletotrichum godetiae]